ncbi:MAG: hypothetical protein ABW168_25165 [Sedimenticola sp.]
MTSLSISAIADTPDHSLWVSGKRAAWKLNENSAALEVVIPDVRKAKAIALDDQRDVIWILTKEARIESYGFDGSPRLNIDIPLESTQLMLQYKALVDEYQAKVHLLKENYSHWKKDQKTVYDAWRKQHKDAYKQWRRDNRHASRKEERQHKKQYQSEEKAKEAEYKQLKRDRERIYKAEYKALKNQLSEYSDLYKKYRKGAKKDSHKIEHHGTGLAVDKQKGVLWIGSEIGLLKISPTGQLLARNSEIKSIRSVAFDIQRASIWAASEHKIFYLDESAELINQIDLTKKDEVEDITFDQKLGELWVRLDDGLLKFNREGTETYRSEKEMDAISPDGTGHLWLLDELSLKRITSVGELQQTIDLKQNNWHEIDAIASDVNNHRLWVLGEQVQWEKRQILRSEWIWADRWNIPFVCNSNLQDWYPPLHLPGHQWQKRGLGKHDDDDNDRGKKRGKRDDHHGKDKKRDKDDDKDHRGRKHGKGKWVLYFWWETTLVKRHDDQQLAYYSADGSSQFSQLNDLDDMKQLVVSGDLYAPTATLVSPVNEGLVTPQQLFQLQVADQGWGVSPSHTRILIDGNVVDANCIDDGTRINCTPVVPITALLPKVQITVQDYAKNYSDTVEVNLKLDTDADGYADIVDTYPSDPTRWRLAQVENLQTKLNGTSVALNWDAHADQLHLKYYDLYRTGVDGVSAIKLNSEPLDALSYVDENVSNGNGYRYRIVAVDHKGVIGEEGEKIPFFVAYNQTPVSALTTLRQGADGLITWGESAGFRYQIYRGLGNLPAEPLTKIDGIAYLDMGALWYNVYKYQLATIADFVDPFTQQAIEVIGPISTSVQLPALPPLTMTIEEGVDDGLGVVERVINMPGRISLSGQYFEAVGPVSITARTTDGNQQVTAQSADGRYRLVIPVVVDTDWILIISESTVAERSVEHKFRLIEDTTPPELTIDGPLERTIDADNFLLMGAAIDKHTSIDAISISSDRFPGLSFGVVQGENGSFSSELPLEQGINLIKVTADDLMGNTTRVDLSIKRTVSLAPELVIESPAQGDVVYDARITLTGVVYSGLPAEQIRIVFADQQILAIAGEEEGIYHFFFDDILLMNGYNQLIVRAETTIGNSEAVAIVQYRESPPAPEVIPAPELEITSHSSETTINSDSITITGLANGGEGTTLAVNGESIKLKGEGDTGGSFKYQLNFAECNGGITQVDFIVTDAGGRSTTKTISFVCDADAPVIALTTGGLSEAPIVNRVLENPFILNGSVSDSNLAGFSINGTGITLNPGTTVGEYLFDSALKLPIGEETEVSLEAWDLAGNRTSKTVLLNADSPVTIEMLSPRPDEEILADADGTGIEVVARMGQLEAGYQVTMALDDVAAQPMNLDGNMAYGRWITNETTGRHNITVSIADANGEVLTSTSTGIQLKDLSLLPLTVDRHIPLNAEKNTEPNSFVALYFNRPIETERLQINVRQTVHGETYDLTKQKGAGFGGIPQPSIIQVHKDMEPVAGVMAYYPTDRYVTFHPAERLHYGAYILVDVIYDGEEMKRFAFTVEPQPTTLSGVVVDQTRTQQQGITLAMPELGLAATTDNNGNYIFQIRGEAARNMRDGRYQLIVNPNMKNPQYGTTDSWVNLQAQRLNVGVTHLLPMLNRSIPFQQISGGGAQTVLARGNMTLDLSEADLLFPDGFDKGNVHVQFLQGHELSFSASGSVVPAWMYGVQPSGISINGDTGITLLMPRLDGDLGYIPPNDTLVAILGFNSSTKLIEVTGIGEIQDQQVSSVGKLPLQSLDYIGYAMVSEEGQQILRRYRDGDISSIDILRTELELAEQ